MSTNPPQSFNLLLTGLRTNAPIPSHFRTLYGSASDLSSIIAADSQRLRDAGHSVTVFFLDETDVAAGLSWLSSKLEEERFDGILIGIGLRLIPEMTGIFTDVVNVVAHGRKGAVMMFNEGPGGNWDAVERSRTNLEAAKAAREEAT